VQTRPARAAAGPLWSAGAGPRRGHVGAAFLDDPCVTAPPPPPAEDRAPSLGRASPRESHRSRAAAPSRGPEGRRDGRVGPRPSRAAPGVPDEDRERQGQKVPSEDMGWGDFGEAFRLADTRPGCGAAAGQAADHAPGGGSFCSPRSATPSPRPLTDLGKGHRGGISNASWGFGQEAVIKTCGSARRFRCGAALWRAAP